MAAGSVSCATNMRTSLTQRMISTLSKTYRRVNVPRVLDADNAWVQDGTLAAGWGTRAPAALCPMWT